MKNNNAKENRRIIWLASIVIVFAGIAVFAQFKTLNDFGNASTSQVLLIISCVIMLMAGLISIIVARSSNTLSVVSDLAYLDDLTGLINRRKFNEALLEKLQVCRVNNKKIGVLILDLDRFKTINDSHGHDAGDKIICQFGERIQKATGINAVACRMSGDEFSVMLEDVNSEAQIALVCDAILKQMHLPFNYEGKKIHATASIGAAIVDGHEDEELSALRMADYALLKSKDNGRNQYMVFDDEMAKHIKRRLKIEAVLKKAIADKDMTLKYQPFVLQNSNTTSGVEAFIRWVDPSEGEIFPSEFIPIAQQLGLLEELGEFILERACLDIIGFDDLLLAINVSSAQFMHEGFINQLKRVLKKTGFKAERLELELSQDLFASDSPNIKSSLKSLREMGVRVALDDFGTSYSSMFFLRDFKLDRIKLDRNFVNNMHKEKDGVEIIENMIGLGSSFSDRLTVEGVETNEQLKLLQKTSANDLQGFYFSKPLTLSELKESEMSSNDKIRPIKRLVG